jgi:hypothetical protein
VHIGGWIFGEISIGRAAEGAPAEHMATGTSHVVGVDGRLRAYQDVVVSGHGESGSYLSFSTGHAMSVGLELTWPPTNYYSMCNLWHTARTYET